MLAGEAYELRGLGPGCRDTPGAQILPHSGQMNECMNGVLMGVGVDELCLDALAASQPPVCYTP